jgi:hypothetical protein
VPIRTLLTSKELKENNINVCKEHKGGKDIKERKDSKENKENKENPLRKVWANQNCLK